MAASDRKVQSGSKLLVPKLRLGDLRSRSSASRVRCAVPLNSQQCVEKVRSQAQDWERVNLQFGETSAVLKSVDFRPERAK